LKSEFTHSDFILIRFLSYVVWPSHRDTCPAVMVLSCCHNSDTTCNISFLKLFSISQTVSIFIRKYKCFNFRIKYHNSFKSFLTFKCNEFYLHTCILVQSSIFIMPWNTFTPTFYWIYQQHKNSTKSHTIDFSDENFTMTYQHSEQNQAITLMGLSGCNCHHKHSAKPTCSWVYQAVVFQPYNQAT